MKYLFTILFIFVWSFNTWSQKSIDSLLLQHIQTVPLALKSDLKGLTEYLITPVQRQEEKLRSIYLWIIHNIEYDNAAVDNERINKNNEDILRRKKAICWGYSTLLKSMCEIANIPTTVISGYVKTSLDQIPFLKYPTHSWNAAKINDRWYLLDATWDSGLLNNQSDFYEKFGEKYYCTSPKKFIINHLPASPKWQLLDCPISIETFQLSTDSLLSAIEISDCSTITDSITNYAELSYHDQLLLKAINTYQFNPTEDNRRELGHTQIEYQEYLSDLADALQANQNIDSLLMVQKQMIELCEVANELTDLFDTQLENCAYNYFNYAVALSQVSLTPENEEQLTRKMLFYFQQASQQLEALPQNIFTEQAIEQSKSYRDYLQKRLSAIEN